MTNIVLETIHGSNLYGLANDKSDVDKFTVVENKIGRTRARYAKQKINGSNDSLVTDLSTFFLYAYNGVPQYLECMYSQMATIDTIYDIRMSFQPNLYIAERTYVRTIRNFWNEGSFKKRRHAARLFCNLESMWATGKFNPTLTEAEIEYCNLVAAGGATIELPTNPLTRYEYLV